MKVADSRKKILFVAGSGGHTAQLAILLEKMGNQHRSELMLERGDELAIRRFSGTYKVHKAVPIRGKDETPFLTVLRVFLNCFQSLGIFASVRPDYIITTGPGLAIPICLLGKALGRKVIVIESWSRTTTRSYVGRILYFCANLFFVQWPEMLKQYPKARYAGRFA